MKYSDILFSFFVCGFRFLLPALIFVGVFVLAYALVLTT